MKRNSFICAVLSLAVLMGSLLVPSAFFNETAYAASPSEKVVKLSADTISYDSTSDECIQIPCASRGGIYFLNGEKLSFYSLSNNKSETAYDFTNDRATIYDSYATADKLYILQYEYLAKNNPYAVTVYNFAKQSVENVFRVSQPASAIGADPSGRIYLSGYDTASKTNKIYLFSSSMSLLSEVSLTDSVNDFGAFDSTNGNFYIDGYYNWIYYGYNHDMHALRVGNVTNNKLKIEETPLFNISQDYYYDRQSPMDMLAGKYFCCESTFNSGLYIVNSNKTNISDLGNTPYVFLAREENISNFDHLASVGSRTVYLDGTKTVVSYVDDETLAEYNPETGVCYGEVKTAHPVFSLLKYNDKIIAIEKSGSDYYLEILNWKRATSVSITGTNTVKIGSTVQLTASTNGTLSESYSWSSSNPKVASVNANGKVFGWSEGSATITVTTKSGIKATFKVTVSPGLPVSSPKKFTVSTKGIKSNNASSNNYTVWSKVVNSYLLQNSDGTFTRAEFVDNQVVLETYSSDGTLKSTKKISAELPVFGGCYSGASYNFLVFGQNNTSDSESKEVLRIVKYNKSWSKLGSVSVNGANTHIPFDAGSLRMTETGGKLYIYTCHEMFADESGVNHQANMTFVVNESSMKIVDEYYDVMNLAQAGYVSHSFNQFIQTDGKNVYRVDHGDAYPRAVSITSCAVNGKITDVNYTLPVDLSNVTGYNPTGASVGGFELSSSNCIIAGNAVDYTKSNADCNGKRNIFVSITDKSLGASKVVWLTKYAASSEITVYTPQLVKIGDDQFLIAWEERDGSNNIQTRFATIDDNGNLTSDVVSLSLRLSDCKPIKCNDGLVRWYVTNNAAPVIYVVNPLKLSCEVHSWDSGKVTKAATCKDTGVKTYTCTVCKVTKTETIAKTTAHKWDSGKVTKAATCKDTGVKTYTCTVCNTTKTETIAKTTAHKWDSGKVTKAATCKDTGVKTYTCTVCKAAKTETIAKTAHKWDGGKVTKAATCAATGVKTYTCTVCKATKTETIAKTTAHKWGAWTTSGKKQTRKCSVCGATESKWITLAAPNNLVLSNTTTNGVTISYSKVAGADGYEIQYYHDGKWTHYVNTGYTSKKWEGAGWGPAGTYDIRVRAYIKTGSGLAYSENWSETKRFYTKPAKVTGLTTTSRSSDGTSLTLKWDAQKWATGYVVYRKGPNNTWVQLVTLTSPTENTYTVKGLTPVYDYGYRVRAYKGGSGNLGAYSDIHSTYTLPPKTKLYTVAQNGKGRMYVSWNLAKSYGYEVILSTKADFSSGNLKYTVSGMYNNKTNLRNLAAKNYYVKVRPYYNKPFGKIYGSWSDAKQIKLS